MEKLYKVELSYANLLLLDGQTDEATQAIINQARTEQSFGFELPLINDNFWAQCEEGK